MNYKYFITSLSLIFLMSCGKKKEQPLVVDKIKMKPPRLEFLWQTDSLLTTCEAVLFDKTSKVIYVTNINNNPWEKDNNGFISTINIKGEITNLKWIEGLSAPKGMGISNGKLYVNDVDDLVEIDIEKREILNTYQVEGSPQLNDITISADGVVYSSGSNSNSIYKLENGALQIVAKDAFQRLNGLLWQKEAMYYLDSGKHHFGALDLEHKTFKTLTTDIGHGDGIVRLENGDFISSSWKGEIYYIEAKDWSKTKLLDTKEQSINAADIDFIPETQMLLVPTFFNNRVVCYQLK
ncbi:MAG: hypothetical protein ABJL44_14745 [Algibacter sp.]